MSPSPFTHPDLQAWYARYANTVRAAFTDLSAAFQNFEQQARVAALNLEEIEMPNAYTNPSPSPEISEDMKALPRHVFALSVVDVAEITEHWYRTREYEYTESVDPNTPIYINRAQVFVVENSPLVPYGTGRVELLTSELPKWHDAVTRVMIERNMTPFRYMNNFRVQDSHLALQYFLFGEKVY